MSDVPRTILHADMDAFYAAIEQRDDPQLRGRPVAVGGAPPRGVVSAASYEARVYGVKSAIPMAQAVKLCPQLTVVTPRMSHYADTSRRIFEHFKQYTPLVEPLSLDEAFLDLTGTDQLFGSAVDVGRELQRKILADLSLTVSIGIGPSKFIAKIASDLEKPHGLVVVPPDKVLQFLHPLPVQRLWGVGQVAQRQLAALGVHTIGDLAALPRETLARGLGQHGEHLWLLSHGIDQRHVVNDREPKSIGQEDTFAQDLSLREELEAVVKLQADRVAYRLRRNGFLTQGVMLKVKTADFVLHTRQRRLDRPTSDGVTIGNVACELLAKELGGLGPVRLTGVTANALISDHGPRQLSLDHKTQQKEQRLGEAMDQVTERFGSQALYRGVAMRAKAARRQTSQPGHAEESWDRAANPGGADGQDG